MASVLVLTVVVPNASSLVLLPSYPLVIVGVLTVTLSPVGVKPLSNSIVMVPVELHPTGSVPVNVWASGLYVRVISTPPDPTVRVLSSPRPLMFRWLPFTSRGMEIETGFAVLFVKAIGRLKAVPGFTVPSSARPLPANCNCTITSSTASGAAAFAAGACGAAAPGTVAPSSGTVAPCSGSVAPCSGSVAPCSGSVAPCSGSVAPCSGSVAPCSGSVAPCSGSVAPCSGSVAPCSGSVAPCSGSVAPCSGSVALCAGVLSGGVVSPSGAPWLSLCCVRDTCAAVDGSCAKAAEGTIPAHSASVQNSAAARWSRFFQKCMVRFLHPGGFYVRAVYGWFPAKAGAETRFRRRRPSRQWSARPAAAGRRFAAAAAPNWL